MANSWARNNINQLGTGCSFAHAILDLWVPQIDRIDVKAVNQFIKGDFSLKSAYSYGKCPLDPITDCYMELLIKPKDLVHELKNYGFKSKIYSSGPSRKSLRVLRFFWELFSPITIFFPRAFKIISIKN